MYTTIIDNYYASTIHILYVQFNFFTTSWVPGRTCTTPCRTWKLENSCKTYTARYDAIQKQLESVCGRDELLSGLLSKAKGQILRVAATLHILFHLSTPENIQDTISEEVVAAAINFVQVCCEHASLITGRSLVSEELMQQAKVSISVLRACFTHYRTKPRQRRIEATGKGIYFCVLSMPLPPFCVANCTSYRNM